ncbi:hypothetical protein RRG08_025276 [Elysia crispata]|uniref:Reverse transcriptase/retrotransposon-derived protein RNase H-like domain-containing protein n=1 Tax=Elysia crispata TaxID=231223 RepID=A0AAE1ABB8_9GAST|nr:hypothetical protein RRG08_025276 [Elysia crispata]
MSQPKHLPSAALPSDANDLGIDFTLLSSTSTAKTQANADTGCQSCLADTSPLIKLGFNTSHVTPTSMKMSKSRPHRDFLEAIQKFPKPRTITYVRSWFGLVNQVAYAEKMQPFRTLLHPKMLFIWTAELDKFFEETKAIIIQEIQKGVEILDKNIPICLATDFSKDGIGFWLLQKHCICSSAKPFCSRTGWKVTLIGNCFTLPAESRYTPIGEEALAVVDAFNKA